MCIRDRDKVLLAYGGGSIKKNGVYEEVIAALEKAGKTIIEFPGIMENPTYKKVLEGTKLVKEKQVDWILAVGGGSVMDCSKAISMAAVSEKDVWDEYWAKKGVVDFEPMPLGAVSYTHLDGYKRQRKIHAAAMVVSLTLYFSAST